MAKQLRSKHTMRDHHLGNPKTAKSRRTITISPSVAKVLAGRIGGKPADEEHNLDHATRRLTTAEIEQAIWNADRVFPHREHSDRALFRSVTDGGKAVGVIVEIVLDGPRPITGLEA